MAHGSPLSLSHANHDLTAERFRLCMDASIRVQSWRACELLNFLVHLFFFQRFQRICIEKGNTIECCSYSLLKKLDEAWWSKREEEDAGRIK
jgi:hypothetical protein